VKKVKVLFHDSLLLCKLLVLCGGIPTVGQSGAAVDSFPCPNPLIAALDTIEVLMVDRWDEVHVGRIEPTLALSALKSVGHFTLL
jgi:hypothetical protein